MEYFNGTAVSNYEEWEHDQKTNTNLSVSGLEPRHGFDPHGRVLEERDGRQVVALPAAVHDAQVRACVWKDTVVRKWIIGQKT